MTEFTKTINLTETEFTFSKTLEFAKVYLYQEVYKTKKIFKLNDDELLAILGMLLLSLGNDGEQ